MSDSTTTTSIFDKPEPVEDGALTSDAPSDSADGAIVMDTAGVDLYDNSEELDAKKNADGGDAIAPPELPERDTIRPNNIGMTADVRDGVVAAVEHKFTDSYKGKEITVNHAERAEFLRAALLDEEVSFRIELEGLDMNVDVAIPTDSFTAAAIAAVNKWGADGTIDTNSDMQWLDCFQRIHVWYQVRAVNGIPTSWSAKFADGVPKLSKLRKFISDLDKVEDAVDTNAVRWRALLGAVSVAEYKYKLCLQNLHDRSFFSTADTD